MFDPDNILPIALEELLTSERDLTECDRLHCNDTIGPCAACPSRGAASVPDEEVA